MRVCLSFCKYGQRSLSSFNVNIFLSLNGIGYHFAPNMIKNIHLHILYSLHSVHVFFFTVHIHSIFINQAILIHLLTFLKTFKDLGSGYSLSASTNPVRGNIPTWFLEIGAWRPGIQVSLTMGAFAHPQHNARDPMIMSREKPVTVRLVPPGTPSIGCLGACRLLHPQPTTRSIPASCSAPCALHLVVEVMRNVVYVHLLPTATGEASIPPCCPPDDPFFCPLRTCCCPPLVMLRGGLQFESQSDFFSRILLTLNFAKTCPHFG